MTNPGAIPAASRAAKLLIALDVDSADKARGLVDLLRPRVGGFKIGLQLFTQAGPALVKEFTDKGVRIFLDLKFHDIPNTVARAVEQAVDLGVWMVNVHAVGGKEMMLRAAEAVRQRASSNGFAAPLLIGVTVLTSSDIDVLKSVGVSGPVSDQVGLLANLAADSGLDGVVASARDVPLIRSSVANKDFLAVTPGIRPSGGTLDDQKRVTTVGGAIAAGSDYLVIGRPVTGAEKPLSVLESIVSE